MIGQNEPVPQVFSPNAAELGKYGKVPVSYFTGISNISIPLTEVKGKNLSLPVYLTYHFFVTDHLGSVRAVTDSSGNIEQINHYGPYGELLMDMIQALPIGPQDSINQYKFIGKEWDSYISSYDFGARYYSPTLARWSTQDSMADNYYWLSPYNYCSSDPLNLVDSSGKNWYSYYDENSSERFLYFEGQLSDAEIKKNGYKDMGLSFWNGDKYYSLFGKVLNNNASNGYPIGVLYSRIDRLIINYISAYKEEYSNPLNQEVISSVTDFSLVARTTATQFVYSGKSFKSEFEGTIIFPMSKQSYRGMIIEGDMSIMIDKMPTKPFVFGGYKNSTYSIQWPESYWLLGKSPNKRSTTLQIRFDEKNARAFMKSINNIFGTNF